MSILRIVFSIILIMVFLLPTTAQAQPNVCGFYGEVTVDGWPVEDGTVVTVWIDNVVVTSTTTYAKTDVDPPIPNYYSITIDGIDNDFEGKFVEFTIGQDYSLVSVHAVFEKGANKSLNLNGWVGGCGGWLDIFLVPETAFATNVCGRDATPNNAVYIYFDGDWITTTTADGEGNFCAPLIPTKTESGEYKIKVVDVLEQTAHATFTIPSLVTSKPPQGEQGPTGPTGEQGPAGEKGQDTDSTLSLVALIIALAAVILVIVIGYRTRVSNN